MRLCGRTPHPSESYGLLCYTNKNKRPRTSPSIGGTVQAPRFTSSALLFVLLSTIEKQYHGWIL